jgi:TolB-like protein
VNLSRDEGTEILSDGITEELINALTGIEGLHVIAQTSAFHFKSATSDIRAIGKRLGVRTILEGSVRRDADRLRVTAQLISVVDGCHLWSQRFDRRMRDLFELQEEIACAIVSALRVNLVGGRLTTQYGNETETYSLYLEGR